MSVPIYRTNGSVVVKVAVTGQPISLGTPFPNGMMTVNRVDIQPLVGNTNPIMVGDYQVAQDQTNGGILLNVFPASGSVPSQMDIYNLELMSCLQTIFINGTAGDGVSINWYIGERN